VPAQEEIVSAWLSAQHAKELPQHRVPIINPESASDHIPASLRAFKAHTLPNDYAAIAELVNAMQAHIESLAGALAAAAQTSFA
jgi:hypothetical protein